MMIKAEADKIYRTIGMEMNRHITLEKAKAEGESELIKADFTADAMRKRAFGESEAIKTIAKARKLEAQQLEQ